MDPIVQLYIVQLYYWIQNVQPPAAGDEEPVAGWGDEEPVAGWGDEEPVAGWGDEEPVAGWL